MAQSSFSIVVVCLNPGEKLAATVQSVLAQQYGNYEIIVKDGGSTDGSLKHLPADSRIQLVESRDRGIYDAMNQALPFTRGQYILFLNCGDVLHDTLVLSSMADAISKRSAPAEGKCRKGRPRIFYGNQFNLRQRCMIYSAPAVNDFTCYRNVPCHQVCFYDSELFKQRGYDLRYRVRADYEHFLYCIYDRRAEAVYTEITVADYEGGGFSETRENRRISEKEHREIAVRYLGRKKAVCYRLVMLLSLAPVRTWLAENERFAAVYNRIKTCVYRFRKR